jgi:hypothetical protein
MKITILAPGVSREDAADGRIRITFLTPPSPQVFRADTEAEMIEKLVIAQWNASLRILELKLRNSGATLLLTDGADCLA